MSAELVLRYAGDAGTVYGNLQLRWKNTVNTPIASATYLEGGCLAIADEYEIVATDTLGVITMTVDCNVKNPYRDMVGKTVTCDGATVNTNLIPGVGLVFAAGTTTGWTAVVTVGQYMTSGGVVTDVLGFGVVEAGVPTSGIRLAVVNVGADPAQSCVVYALPGGYYYGSGFDTFISKIAPHTNPSRHENNTGATYSITFADWKDGGGGKKTADVYVGGVKAIEDAIFDGSTIYEYGSDNGYVDGVDGLPGLQIILADTTSDPSAVTITLVTSGDQDWTEFAEDISGAPGTYSNQDLTLTESGEPSGTITASGTAYFWVRKNIPENALPGAMRKGTIRTRGLTT